MLAVAGAQVVAALAARAQAPAAQKAPRRIGLLAGTSAAFFGPSRAGFEAALRKFGWSPGNDLAIHYRFSAGDAGAAERALGELLAARIEVLVAAGAMPVRTLRARLPSLPIVALFDVDPVTHGLAASMSRPEGNLTGVAPLARSQELAKMMETLRDAFPTMRTLGVLHRGEPGAHWREEREAAARFGIELVLAEVPGDPDMGAAIASLARRKVDVVWVLFHPAWSIRDVAQALRRARMPAISDVAEFAHAGGLMTYGEGAEMVAVFEQLARLADRVLRGTHPGQIPIESPAHPKLVINARTARDLGYAPPPAILLRADRLID